MKNLKYTFKKFNLPNNTIIIYGNHSSKSALNNKNRKILSLATTKKFYRYWEEYLKNINLNVNIIILEIKELDLITKNNTHQNVIVFAKKLNKYSLNQYLTDYDKEYQKVLILDQLTDPNNVGAIIRSAFAFKFDAVCILKNKSASETSSIIKASAGEIEKIMLIELGNLVQEIQKLKKNGFIIYSLCNEGKVSIRDVDKNDKKIALIVGSEGKGVRNLTKKYSDYILKIPINENCNSLNVSNATAIALYEISQK